MKKKEIDQEGEGKDKEVEEGEEEGGKKRKK